MKRWIQWLGEKPRYTIPVVLFLCATLAAYLLGFRGVEINYRLWQLLDQQALQENPIHSLYLLHAQPPLLNALLAILLKLSAIIGRPELWATILFLSLGLVTSVLFFHVLHTLTGSLTLSAAGLALYLLNPGTLYFSHLYFYPYLLSSFLIILLYLAERFLYVSAGKGWMLLGVVLTTGVIVNTRALYHPAWGILLFVTLVLPTFFSAEFKSKIKRPMWPAVTVLLALVLLIWPLKNKLLFGQFTSSTWTGFNLTRRTPLTSSMIAEYWNNHIVPDKMNTELEIFQERKGISNTRVLEQVRKTSGGTNWNHYLFVVVNEKLTKEGIQYRLQRLTLWKNMALSHYFRWTQPKFVDSYTQKILGPDRQLYHNMASAFTSTVFYDLRPEIADLGPGAKKWIKERIMEEHNEPVPFTIFGLFIFPLFLTVSFTLTLSAFLTEEPNRGTLLLIALFTILWVLAVPILTDGYEGNRMRYAITPYMILFFMVMFHRRD